MSEAKAMKAKAKPKTSTVRPTTKDPLGDSVRQAIVERMQEWVEAIPDPDKPMIASAGSGEVLSPSKLLHEVVHRTPRGEELVSDWAALLVKNIKGTPLP